MIKDKLNICFVSDFFYPGFGGVESHMFQLAQCLIQRGHKVVVITHARGNRKGVRWMSSGLKVYYIPIKTFNTPNGVTTIPFAMGTYAFYRNIFIREKIDIVHSHQSTSCMGHEAIIAATLMNIRTSFTDHSLFGFGDAGGVNINKVMKLFSRLVIHCISVSHTSKMNTVLRTNLDPRKVSVIPNAVDTSMFKPAPKRISNNNTITIIVITRLVYRKGVTLLQELIPIICKKFSNIKFIIGGNGPLKTPLEQMREKNHLEDRVEMLGAVPPSKVRDVSKFYQICLKQQKVLIRGDIFLNCSLTEAFGISIIEAASCGLQIVSTDVGGVPEVLPPDMMSLAKPNVESLEKVLSNVITNFDFQLDRRQEFHERVSKMYNWKSVTKRTEKVYDKVMSTKPIGFVGAIRETFNIGLVYGPLCCLILAIMFIYHVILEFIVPRNEIDIAIDFPNDNE